MRLSVNFWAISLCALNSGRLSNSRELSTICQVWDLSNVSIPVDVAFRGRGQTGYVSFDADPNDVWNYWERSRISNQRLDLPTIHEALHLPGGIQSAVLSIINWKEGLPLRSHSFKGIFVLLRGDSHMRIILNMYIMTMTHDVAVIKKSGYNKKTYHLPHLFCCERTGTQFSNCVVEIGSVDLTLDDLPAEIIRRIQLGQMCALWESINFFDEDVGGFEKWKSLGLLPDLICVNGGAHYHDYAIPPPSKSPLFREDIINYKANMQRWMESTETFLESLEPDDTTVLVVFSSPFSYFSEWQHQLAAFEDLRVAVASLRPLAKQRASYVDFHTLAATDVCGFSNKFPSRMYEYWNKTKPGLRNQCGHVLKPADAHLCGGAYMYAGELAFNLMRSRIRRCDPDPHQPSLFRVDDAALIASRSVFVH